MIGSPFVVALQQNMKRPAPKTAFQPGHTANMGRNKKPRLVLTCPICQQVFVTSWELNLHRLDQHPDSEPEPEPADCNTDPQQMTILPCFVSLPPLVPSLSSFALQPLERIITTTTTPAPRTKRRGRPVGYSNYSLDIRKRIAVICGKYGVSFGHGADVYSYLLQAEAPAEATVCRILVETGIALDCEIATMLAGSTSRSISIDGSGTCLGRAFLEVEFGGYHPIH
jgi:hypothetical protein